MMQDTDGNYMAPISQQLGTFKLHPNPTTGKFRVENLELGVAVQVYDLLGREIALLPLAITGSVVDLSSYPVELQQKTGQ